jgi:tetratricopeptide (TPR) repeat protein
MKKYSWIMLMAIFALFILLVACRPPDVEGLVVRINQQLFDDETYNLAEKAVQNNPDNAEAWYYYGWLYGRKGNFSKMNEAFDKAMALNPQQQVKVDGAAMSVKDAVERVKMSYFAENFNAGKSQYDKARATDDKETQDKLYEKAVEKFSKAHEANPARLEPLQPLAISLLLLGDTTEAENTFQEAVKMQPNNEDLLVTVGDFYLQMKKQDKAEETYKKILSLNENNENAYMGLGQLETLKGNWEKATQYFEKALAINPDNTNVAFNIGVSFYNQEKYKEAIPYLKKTIETETENKQLYQILGICYVQSKMYDEGLTFLEGAVEKFPNDADLWNYLALIYANKGMKEKAEEAMNKTKELEKNM